MSTTIDINTPTAVADIVTALLKTKNIYRFATDQPLYVSLRPEKETGVLVPLTVERACAVLHEDDVRPLSGTQELPYFPFELMSVALNTNAIYKKAPIWEGIKRKSAEELSKRADKGTS